MAEPFLPKFGIMHARMRRLWAVTLFCIILPGGLASFGCEFPGGTDGGGEGPGHRAQKLALSPEQELQLGREAYKQVLSNPNKYGHVVPADRPECQRVRRIAERIIHAA